MSETELAWMNETEAVGIEYDLVQLSSRLRIGGRSLGPVYAYVHKRVIQMDGGPVRLSAFSVEQARFPAWDQRQILTAVLDALDYQRGLPIEERHRSLRQDSAARLWLTRALEERLGRAIQELSPGPAVTMKDVQPVRIQ